jgi:hypothetical protein
MIITSTPGSAGSIFFVGLGRAQVGPQGQICTINRDFPSYEEKLFIFFKILRLIIFLHKRK